jgi:translocation protein SEC62
MALLPHPSS